MVGVFTQQKLANAIKQGLPASAKSQLLYIYQHITYYKESKMKCFYVLALKLANTTNEV